MKNTNHPLSSPPSDSENKIQPPHVHHHLVHMDHNVGKNKKYTTILLYVLFGILFTAICIYFVVSPDKLDGLSHTVGNILSPILIGLALAYILAPIVNFFEIHVFGSQSQHKYNRARRRLLKAKLAYDNLRLAETRDEEKLSAAEKELIAAKSAIRESKAAVRAEADALADRFYKKQNKKKKKLSFYKENLTPPEHPRRFPALLLSYLLFFLLLTVFVWIVVPQCIASISDFIVLIRNYAESLPSRVQNIRLPESLSELLTDIDWETKLLEAGTSVINQLSGFLMSLLSKLPAIVSSALSGITNLILGVFMSIYFLSSKELLLGQISRGSRALLGIKGHKIARHIVRKTDQTFGSFVQGKLIDSLLMTVICITLFTVLDIPYAALITLITVVTNLIPYFGPFIGAIPSGIIILISAPNKLLIYAILILIIQQIEGNILEPRILGRSMGLAPVWIMIAVLVMGELFGVMGMVLGVPIFTVFYTLIGEFCEKRIQKRRAMNSPPKSNIQK
ncbi:MAG: AI-2E family transporter [Clostridia bacterium]|nr:AI-2E family transporter [Clostridia bacterium]